MLIVPHAHCSVILSFHRAHWSAVLIVHKHAIVRWRVCTSRHRRMGTLWLGGGAEGLIAQNFTQITGADTGFPEGGISQAPPPLPLDIVCVTSFALRKIEKHPPPTIAAAPKKDRRCPKN